uniref:Uncharacterized protein n=1 Tax=Kalanchoe fedtschenkoi TaxID=63787 RepID=A0A7N0UDH7_KALFE
MMNSCAIQQKSSFAPSREDVGSHYVVCPKPRRVGIVRSAGWRTSHQADVYDSKAGNELLDIILSKGGGQDAKQTHTQMASSPPFFCGSPPTRVSNPLIQDARFIEEKQRPLVTFSTLPVLNSGMPSPPSSSSRKGGFVRSNFGNDPAVRVEGFEALDRDRRNCSITALA